MHRLASVALALLTLFATACDQPASTTRVENTPPPAHAWLLSGEPAGALGVVDAKASAKEGDTVVVRARIGGRMEPITAQSPVFVVMDLGLPYCGETHEDACPTPWDYCCDTPETIKANAATVQIVSDGPQPDPIAAGLSPLDEVILVGTVGPRPTEDVLTIRATGVYRVGG